MITQNKSTSAIILAVAFTIIAVTLGYVALGALTAFLFTFGYFGYFLAWTFFASMGITELAHFVLPFLTDKPYGYFPGMYSVIVLAPVAWWGMYKLSKNQIS